MAVDAASGGNGVEFNSSDPRIARLFAALPRPLGLAVASLGALVTLGWLTRTWAPFLALTGILSMKANTGVAFMLSGTALWLLGSRSKRLPLHRLAAGICAAGGALIGLLNLSEYAFGWNLGIDELLVRDPAGLMGLAYPGRLAINTAIVFVFAGTGLLLLAGGGRRARQLSEAAALVSGAIGLVALVGYGYGYQPLYQAIDTLTAMAVHTAVGVIVLAVGILALHPTEGLMGRFASAGAGGIMARRLFLAVVFVPLAIGFLTLAGHDAGFYSAGDLAIATVLVILALTVLISTTSAVLDRADARRQLAEDRVRLQASQATILADVSQALAVAGLDDGAVLETAARGVATMVGDACVIRVLSLDREWLVPVAYCHARPEAAAILDRQFTSTRQHPDAGLPGKVMQSGKALLMSTVNAVEKQMLLEQQYGAYLEYVGLDSAIIVPLPTDAGPIGTVTLLRDAGGQPYTVDDQHFLQELADRIALAIVNARLYESVRRAEEDAQQANRQLESFSYSVSHDLRAPLRSIDGFSRILMDEYASQLAPEALEYLQLVRDNTQQMGQLIDDLLAFSRMGRQELHKQEVEPAVLVQQALRSLQAEMEGRQVAITIGELLPCHADPGLLKQVFANLLGNALKYTRRRECAQIEVGSWQADDEQVYFVRDNGVGFDMQYVGKLFGVFQRLHRAEEYEGTGVGLATTQRIIYRHGGRVWAEGAVDRGATFFFALNSPKGGKP